MPADSSASDGTPLPLRLAISQYDHVTSLWTEPAKGRLALSFSHPPIAEIFRRFLAGEWDAAELSLGAYVARRSRGDDTLTAIPVFPSRLFRHSSLFVRKGSGIRTPADLAGRKIGLASWSQTAGIYVRALLAHERGVPLDSIEWIFGGINTPGAGEADAELPAGFRQSKRDDVSLDTLLAAGEIDAVISPYLLNSARGPEAVTERLIAASVEAESDYYRRTGIFPIMHVVALRRPLHEAYPWLAQELLEAFEAAKRRSYARFDDPTLSRFPFPWAAEQARFARSLFGEDYWPYGIDANRKTLEAFLSYAVEQGVAARPLSPEELFA
jgi:4,5-dihydroxyphthalate decarboxylase